MCWIASSKVQECPSVLGHTCWLVPTKCSPLSSQSWIQRHNWAIMMRTISSQWLFILKIVLCGFKPILGRVITDPQWCALQWIHFPADQKSIHNEPWILVIISHTPINTRKYSYGTLSPYILLLTLCSNTPSIKSPNEKRWNSYILVG